MEKESKYYKPDDDDHSVGIDLAGRYGQLSRQWLSRLIHSDSRCRWKTHSIRPLIPNLNICGNYARTKPYISDFSNRNWHIIFMRKEKSGLAMQLIKFDKRTVLTGVDPGCPHHHPNPCHLSRSSSSVVSLAFVSNSPSSPSKQHFHIHKQPSPLKDPWIEVALQKGVHKNNHQLHTCNSNFSRLRFSKKSLKSKMPKKRIKGKENQSTWKTRISERKRVDPFASAASSSHVGRHQSVVLRRNIINLYPKFHVRSLIYFGEMSIIKVLKKRGKL